MCIIVHGNDKQLLTTDRLDKWAKAHPDGVGVMFLDGGRVIAAKVADSREHQSLIDLIPERTEYGLHFRMATHGPVTQEFAHPFPLHKGYLMHNGVISGFGDDARSDTAHFADLLQAVCADTSASVRKALETYASGNRFLLCNPADGFTRFGTWHSEDAKGDSFVAYSSSPDPMVWSFGGDNGREEWEKEWRDYRQWMKEEEEEEAEGDITLPPWERNGYRDVWQWLSDNPDDAAELLESLYWEVEERRWTGI